MRFKKMFKIHGNKTILSALLLTTMLLTLFPLNANAYVALGVKMGAPL